MEPHEMLFGTAADASQVSESLTARYRIHVEPAVSVRVTYLDTADWRLYETGLSLRDSRRGRSGQLRLADRSSVLACAASPAGPWPRTVQMLPRSAVRDRIAATVGPRALLPLAEVAVRSLALRVLDDQDKTRVRIQVNQQRLLGASPRPLPLEVTLESLRGYERDGRRCAAMLSARLPAGPMGLDAAAVALSAAGRRPGESQVASRELDPDAPAISSTASVLRRWLTVVELVRDGVLDDVDIEFLHDLRTAVTGTRAVLSLGSRSLPAETVEHFATEFAWLGRVTGTLRDLDVWQLELAELAAETNGPDELAPARAILARRRSAALRGVRVALRSRRYEGLREDWQETLTRWSAYSTASPGTREFGTDTAMDAYRRIVKAAAGVTELTPADDLHRLRKRCKRMRYLLDGYAAVYDRQPRRDVVRALKSLQDCLGDIQDAFVQDAYVSDLAADLHQQSGTAQTLLALGALRQRTREQDALARRTLARRLTEFCSAATRDQVANLGVTP